MALRQNSRKEAVGRFIHQYARWQLWVTLTYTEHQENRRTVEHHIRNWLNGMARLSYRHIHAAIGVEYHLSGSLHVHALLGQREEGGAFPSCASAQSLWTHGNSVIETFDPDRGAASYLAKDGLWGILVGCPRRARCRRRHGCSEQSRELAIALP